VEQHETLRPRVQTWAHPVPRESSSPSTRRAKRWRLRGGAAQGPDPAPPGARRLRSWMYPAISVVHLGFAVIPDRVRALPYWRHLATTGRSER
jgi:hypothetical protein